MKRSNGEGTVFKRKDGRWCGAYYDDLPCPQRHYIYGNTQSEVKRKLKEMKDSLRPEEWRRGSEYSLEEWVLYFLENYKKNEIKAKTARPSGRAHALLPRLHARRDP